ncbi:hypothetical protein Y1Q_0018630 [Alligator mississippiensis]|uniref:Uncharacterized protein n=1 Tax=Alligator mississippiensis TaxID=8496 RepID=A0A151NRP9_ALLMI|nr:hypothetical protein Y1Q_0018630 [Alligator mississippiensis]
MTQTTVLTHLKFLVSVRIHRKKFSSHVGARDSNKNTAQLAQGVHRKLSLLASDPAHNTKKGGKKEKKN